MAIIKKELRQQILKQRQSLSAQEVREKSEAIYNQLLNLKYFQQASAIMVYVDFRNEVQTQSIIREILSQGKRAIIPVCQQEGWKLIPSEVYNFPEDLEPGTWGILEPKPGRLRPIEPTEIDLVLIPGVAFDQEGNRLGYGAGYYDRFLAKVSSETVFIALAFDLQVVSNTFPSEHDIPVHFILTETGLIDCRQLSSERR
ncbi:MAG: 5-formyltetrahydrofolate cyclo-ligase [Bacillota bacterium]|nr:5-formyltetrahydrofolate cyclo-ligase [Bacillota bacterium]